ncbi:hypothetical protein EDB83DRAFT_2312591 [Lactarius deliciosus]|nr:hypothetical protein EDB83DRAFT_2312591 [Lactarius deliciosus]
MYASVITSRSLCLELLVCAAVNSQLQLLRELEFEHLKSSSIAITASSLSQVPQFSRTTPVKNLGQFIASRCSPPIQFGQPITGRNGDAVSEGSTASVHRRPPARYLTQNVDGPFGDDPLIHWHIWVGAGVASGKSGAPTNEIDPIAEAAWSAIPLRTVPTTWDPNSRLSPGHFPGLSISYRSPCIDHWKRSQGRPDGYWAYYIVKVEELRLTITQEPAQAKGIETLEPEHWNRDLTHWSYLTWLRPLKLRVKRAEPDIDYVSGAQTLRWF